MAPEAAGGVRQGDPAGPFGVLAERSTAPDVLCQRPDVVDVLEALPHRLVAEPLAHGLRRVPAMNEQGSREAKALAPGRQLVHRHCVCRGRKMGGTCRLTYRKDMCIVYDTQH